jgi:hypothetical protein
MTFFKTMSTPKISFCDLNPVPTRRARLRIARTVTSAHFVCKKTLGGLCAIAGNRQCPHSGS